MAVGAQFVMVRGLRILGVERAMMLGRRRRPRRSVRGELDRRLRHRRRNDLFVVLEGFLGRD